MFNTNIDWSLIDSVYNYFAIDNDGEAYLYAKKPVITDNYWTYDFNSYETFCICVGYADSKDWKLSLQSRFANSNSDLPIVKAKIEREEFVISATASASASATATASATKNSSDNLSMVSFYKKVILDLEPRINYRIAIKELIKAVKCAALNGFILQIVSAGSIYATLSLSSTEHLVLIFNVTVTED